MSNLDEIINKLRAGELLESEKCNAFDGCDLMGADLSNLDLSAINFKGMSLFKVNFTNSNLFGVDMSNADCTGANFTEANLSEANLSRAGLGHAIFIKSNLFGANLEEATLTGATCKSSDLRTANFHNCRIREALIEECDCINADFSGVEFSSTELKKDDFRDCNFQDARLRNLKGYESSTWIGTDIRNINFSGAYELRRHVVDENYIFEFRNNGGLPRKIIYYIWLISSDCGRSFVRWGFLIFLQMVLFALLYSISNIYYGNYETWLSPFYFSVVTMTTLGYGDVLPKDLFSQILVIIHVASSYIMLGGLVSILTNKLARRAD